MTKLRVTAGEFKFNAKLEKELGQPLFERQGRTIRMTPAGQVLQNHAQKWSDSYQKRET